MEPQEVKRIIEGLLFISDRPVSLKRLGAILTTFEAHALRQLLEELKHEYVQAQHAFRIQEVAGGYQVVTDPALAPWIKRALQLPREDVVSKAALETLAIIAYRQPITKAEIELIRGVDGTATLETLLEHQFIRVVGRKETPGRPLLYGTTAEFLRHFGLNSVNDLPPMAKDTQVPTLPPAPSNGPAEVTQAASAPSTEAPHDPATAPQHDASDPGDTRAIAQTH